MSVFVLVGVLNSSSSSITSAKEQYHIPGDYLFDLRLQMLKGHDLLELARMCVCV